MKLTINLLFYMTKRGIMSHKGRYLCLSHLIDTKSLGRGLRGFGRSPCGQWIHRLIDPDFGKEVKSLQKALKDAINGVHMHSWKL